MPVRAALFVGILLLSTLHVAGAAEPAETWQQHLDTAQEARFAGNQAKAIKALEQALLAARELGPDDPRYLRTLSEFGIYMARTGRVRKISGLFDAERVWIEETFGENHPYALDCLLEHGDLLGALGSPKKAFEALQGVLKKAMEAGHRDTAQDALRRLAHLYQRYGENEAAITTYRKIELLTRDDPERRISDVSLHIFGRLLVEAEELEEAARVYNKLYHRNRTRLPQDPYAHEVMTRYNRVLGRIGLQGVARDLQILQHLDNEDPAPVSGWIYKTREQDIPNPGLVYKQEPIFPEKARLERKSGSVILEVLVDTKGVVRDWEVLRTNRAGYGFEEAAIAAVSVWRYEPMVLGDATVAYIRTVFVDFILH